jgi:hypothetical protein
MVLCAMVVFLAIQNIVKISPSRKRLGGALVACGAVSFVVLMASFLAAEFLIQINSLTMSILVVLNFSSIPLVLPGMWFIERGSRRACRLSTTRDGK